jgi:hypothetical protein
VPPCREGHQSGHRDRNIALDFCPSRTVLWYFPGFRAFLDFCQRYLSFIMFPTTCLDDICDEQKRKTETRGMAWKRVFVVRKSWGSTLQPERHKRLHHITLSHQGHWPRIILRYTGRVHNSEQKRVRGFYLKGLFKWTIQRGTICETPKSVWYDMEKEQGSGAQGKYFGFWGGETLGIHWHCKDLNTRPLVFVCLLFFWYVFFSYLLFLSQCRS